ncbi:MAG: hypothetical protein R3268_13695, partial [Acidiferrobacterales bacterium]|nr:hypothetical protein [Acidiferrobacterales bacterium]
MIDVLTDYGLFLAKAVTVVAALGVIAAFTIAMSRRARPSERLEVKHLNQKYEAMAQVLKRSILPRKAYKKDAKAEKARKKSEAKQEKRGAARKRIYVIHFRGDIKATAVSSL